MISAETDSHPLPVQSRPPLSAPTPPRESKDVVFTVAEIAALLKVTPCTIYDLVSRGFLKPARGIRHLRITVRSFEHYLKLSESDNP
jgi:excisionase family DNA binding protein